MPSVSVVIPTYNRVDRLRRVLAGLERQTAPLTSFEVLVISDGSTDGTDAFLESVDTPLRLVAIRQPNGGPARARNVGIARASGELVLFLDDDVVPSPELIAEHLRAHAATRGDVVVLGPMLTPDDARLAPWVRWEQMMLYKQYDDMQAGRWQPTARQFYTGNTSLARRHLVAAGGFDTGLRRAEDVELAYRLASRGLGFVFNIRAAGYHYAERSLESWLAIPSAYGRSDVLFWRDRGQRWLLPTILYELRGRQLPVRALTRATLDRPWLSGLLMRLMLLVAALAARIGITKIERGVYSGLFHLRYYQGVADELGGRGAFFTHAAAATAPVDVPGVYAHHNGAPL